MNKHCYQCGKRGHVKANCRSKRPKTSGENNPTPSSQVLPSTSQGNDEACGFCAKRGHNVSNCFLKAAIDKRRCINFYSTGKSAGATEIVVNGHQFWALIDTGADLSLMSEKFLHLFEEKVICCNMVIKGIAKATITATKKFTELTKISGIEIPITYFFVSHTCLDYDVLIGRDIHKDTSLVTITDHQGSRIERRQLPGINRILDTFVSDDKFDCCPI